VTGGLPLPRGVLTALVTPVDEAGRLDEAGLDRLVDGAVAGGVDGLSPCGSTGEGPRLTLAQRLHITRRVRERAPRLPVVPGLLVGSVEAAQEELVELARLGATAALVAPPSYYPCDDADLPHLFTVLADAAPLPLVLYNIPVHTGVPVTVPAVARLADHDNVVGIKDSSRDVEYLQSVLLATAAAREEQRFVVYTGADTLLLPSLLLGADGTIAPSSNLVPELGVGVVDAFDRADLATAEQLQTRLVRVVQACRTGAFPAGWKAALSLAGTCGPHLLPPASPLPPALVADLATALRAAGAPLSGDVTVSETSVSEDETQVAG